MEMLHTKRCGVVRWV